MGFMVTDNFSNPLGGHEDAPLIRVAKKNKNALTGFKPSTIILCQQDQHTQPLSQHGMKIWKNNLYILCQQGGPNQNGNCLVEEWGEAGTVKTHENGTFCQ